MQQDRHSALHGVDRYFQEGGLLQQVFRLHVTGEIVAGRSKLARVPVHTVTLGKFSGEFPHPQQVIRQLIRKGGGTLGDSSREFNHYTPYPISPPRRLPPRTCMWRCGTSWPPSSPWLTIRR